VAAFSTEDNGVNSKTDMVTLDAHQRQTTANMTGAVRNLKK